MIKNLNFENYDEFLFELNNIVCENDFNDNAQIELALYIQHLSQNGVYVVASNSDPHNANEQDEFFDNLYADFNIERVQAARMVNSNARRRGPINELLISNIAAVF